MYTLNKQQHNGYTNVVSVDILHSDDPGSNLTWCTSGMMSPPLNP